LRQGKKLKVKLHRGDLEGGGAMVIHRVGGEEKRRRGKPAEKT